MKAWAFPCSQEPLQGAPLLPPPGWAGGLALKICDHTRPCPRGVHACSRRSPEVLALGPAQTSASLSPGSPAWPGGEDLICLGGRPRGRGTKGHRPSVIGRWSGSRVSTGAGLPRGKAAGYEGCGVGSTESRWRGEGNEYRFGRKNLNFGSKSLYLHKHASKSAS